MEINFRDVYIFVAGFSISILTLCLIAMLNGTTCIKCGHDCTDSAVYCDKCGQQLRIVEEFKK